MDLPTPWQTFLLTSLLDAGIAVALAYRRRLEEGRVLRLVPGGAMVLRTRRARRVKRPVVAVLVSRSKMATQLRDALGERALLRFTCTWAELERVVARVSPVAIFADPLADESGDPERHLLVFAALRRPVILYTDVTLVPVRILLRLGRCGIREILFHPYDDGLDQLVGAFAAVAGEGSGPPLQAA